MKVIKEKCVGCGACSEICPMEAITVDEVATIDNEKCMGCGACVSECPNEAIIRD
ncbi:MAG: hypothetical protein PWP31_895 [Clostridia bacterium]|nr:hypothetical protein [Clostridia bacterium]